MPFARTTKLDDHWHVGLFNIPQGNGLTSEDGGHRHELRLKSGGVPGADAPFILQDWEVLPADGHTHYLEQLRGNVVETPNDKAEYSELLQLFEEEIKFERENRIRADESEAFYAGDQWEQADRQALEEAERAALTINRIEALVDSLSGSMRQNRQDWRVRPMEGGDQKTADICTLMLKSVAILNGIEGEENDVCDDVIIVGRGLFNCQPDINEDGEDYLLVESFPHRDAYFGPHTKKNLSDLEHMSKCRWFSPAKLKQRFPKHADEIPDSWIGPEGSEKLGNPTGQKYRPIHGLENNLWDVTSNRLRVVEMWRKEFTNKAVVFVGNEQDPWDSWTTAEANKARKIPTVTVDWVPVTKMRKTMFTAGVILEDEYPDLPRGVRWPLIPSYGHLRNNRWWGKVEAAKDPQRDTNKRYSQLHDIINKMAGYGWFITRDMFETDEEYEAFKDNSSSMGWVCEVRDIQRKPERSEGIKIPGEVVNGLRVSEEMFDTVTAYSMKWVNGSGEMSGDSISERQRNALLPNEFLFDNFRQAKRILGKNILAWIQKLYSPKQIARLVLSVPNLDQQKIGGQQADKITEADIVAMLQNKDLTKYDVIVSEESWSPTTRMANFRTFSKLPAMPLPVLIEMSDMPYEMKTKALSVITQQQQAEKSAEDSKMKMEIGKTLVAKGADPRAVMGAGQGGPSNGTGPQSPTA